MTNITVGPFYATAVADLIPPPYSTVVNPTNAQGTQDGTYMFDQGPNVDLYFSSMGIPAGSTFVSCRIEHYGYAYVQSGYIRYRQLYPLFLNGTIKTIALSGSTGWRSVTYTAAEIGTPLPDPSTFSSQYPLVRYSQADATPGQVYTDAFRIYVTYTPPNQSVSPLPVVIRPLDPGQSASKADPTDPVTYTNEVRGGELVSRARVNAVRFGAQPTTNLDVGTVWISSADSAIRVWDGTQWKYFAQPDSLLLGSLTTRSVQSADWLTILAAELPNVPNSWGYSWLVTGLGSGSDARVRLNQDDAKVWSLTTYGAFGYFESAGVYGVERLANPTLDNVLSTAFVMPTTVSLIEFQMRRQSATVANVVTSFTLWAHPR